MQPFSAFEIAVLTSRLDNFAAMTGNKTVETTQNVGKTEHKTFSKEIQTKNVAYDCS